MDTELHVIIFYRIDETILEHTWYKYIFVEILNYQSVAYIGTSNSQSIDNQTYSVIL